MRASTMMFGAAGAAAALVTGFATYSSLGEPPEPVSAPVGVERDKSDVPERQPRVRFLPCEPGARLEGKVCVTRVVRTVQTAPAAVPAAVPAAAPVSRPRPEAPAAPDPGSGHDDRDDRDDDHSGHGSGGDDDHDVDHDEDHDEDHDDDHDDEDHDDD